jgi:hypothetical protein
MNPLRWTREQQLAGIIICFIGGVCGLLFAWMQSPFHTLAVTNLSVEWADYSNVFLIWVQNAHYWP